MKTAAKAAQLINLFDCRDKKNTHQTYSVVTETVSTTITISIIL